MTQNKYANIKVAKLDDEKFTITVERDPDVEELTIAQIEALISECEHVIAQQQERIDILNDKKTKALAIVDAEKALEEQGEIVSDGK